MAAWTNDELETIAATDELRIASLRNAGSLRKPVTIWVVRLGDDLYVRSVRGPTSGWYRGTQERHEGHVEAGGVEKDVTFAEADHGLDDEIDDAYRSKYRGYTASVVESMLTPEVRSTTLRLVPR
jgi:hypothetical protein